MSVSATQAFITVVGADHTITLPSEMLPGTTVAVVAVPAASAASEAGAAARLARFAATRSAIESAMRASERPGVDDAELDARIERARHAPAG